MGQIIGMAAKPKRCNLNQLSQVPTPAAGEHILVSSDNSMNATGQGNFDCYIVGDGTTSASFLELKKVDTALDELLKDEYTIAAAINDIKHNVIPNEFMQVFQKDVLTEDVNNTITNGTLQNSGIISGTSYNGRIYCIKNDYYSMVDVWAYFVDSYASYKNACAVAFFSSETINQDYLISCIPRRDKGLNLYLHIKVPDNTKLICINEGYYQGSSVEGQNFIIYKDLRKTKIHKTIDSLVVKDKERALSANMGEELFNSMFHNDAAHARTMQKDRPFMKNVFLDCGRKFFSVANIKRVIDMMETVDLRNLVLDYSNHQGFRFALDDMSITTDDGITYDISQGLSTDYLSESDMDELITYAKSKDINIIGGLNLPGHARALLAPIFNTSSINLDSETQQLFAAAVTEKYATYFESKGAAYYYLGGDESGAHAKYGFFMNRMMHIILKHNMIPLIWNDQICRSDQGEINKPYINDGAICMYWGANNQSAVTIEKNNFQQINSSMQIYWILGASRNPTVNDISNFDINLFHGSTIKSRTVRKNIVGAQFCMWMDGVGGSDDKDSDGTDVVDRCLPLIEAFGNTIKNQTGIARISTYRPQNPTSGDFFFDTTLGKPIWYNGTAWVDSVGTIV